MWIFSRILSFLVLAFIVPFLSHAQNCNISISGLVKDISSGTPISYANVYLKESMSGGVTDSLGYFTVETICLGNYHLQISHIGCETLELYLAVTRDTFITVLLDHHSQLLDEVDIIGKGGKLTTQESQSLNSEKISHNTNKNLATMLADISGVSVIKNGSGISKPVVHGLYGNRLTILNNGIAQSGQQWGVDHSPEIDPLVANRITVVKGVGALEYQGNSLGSVILVEPKRIDQEPHLHGEARYFFESNGLGNGINLELQQYNKKIAWRMVGTIKKSGDNRTSSYYLRNTGNQEGNGALQLEKKWNKKWNSSLYLSSFNAEIGVLRGSHIGNLTDLTEALERDIPFFTEEDFSYSLDAPFQQVNHHMLKFKTRFNLSDKHWIDFTYAGQYNLRKEFDIRRSGRSDSPALSLEQISSFAEGKFQSFMSNNWEIKTGIQLNNIDNTNLPETGILPLIPDYKSSEFGFFGLLTKTYDQTRIEFGGRYDFEIRNVAAISKTLPREIVRYKNSYHSLNLLAGITQEINDGWILGYNIGIATRNPEVNELYSNGLHQGVSGIEEGDPSLSKEFSVKNTLSIKGKIQNKLFIESLVYYQNIHDYIFLDPQDEIRLTIRGAFPLFKYEQTDARLFGFDLMATYEISDRLNIKSKYSYLHGSDQGNELPLVFMPSNNQYNEVNFQIPKVGQFQKVAFQINNSYVFEQKNLLPSQDFTLPPKAYNLIGMKVSAERQLRKQRLKMFVRAENLLNITYRDYLNRLRYFANDLGTNVVIGINVSF